MGLAGAVGGSFLLDKPARNALRNPESGFGRTGTFFEVLGSNGAVALPVVFYAGGWAADSETSRKAGVVGLEALAAAGLAADVMKPVFGRERPYAGDGPGAWHLFQGNWSDRASFPSGHAASAFAVATVVSEAYDRTWVSALSYGLAASVGAGRIVQDKHWAGDVAAGAALGYVAGRAAWKWESRKGWAAKLYTDGRSLVWVARF